MCYRQRRPRRTARNERKSDRILAFSLVWAACRAHTMGTSFRTVIIFEQTKKLLFLWSHQRFCFRFPYPEFIHLFTSHKRKTEQNLQRAGYRKREQVRRVSVQQ